MWDRDIPPRRGDAGFCRRRRSTDDIRRRPKRPIDVFPWNTRGNAPITLIFGNPEDMGATDRRGGKKHNYYFEVYSPFASFRVSQCEESPEVDTDSRLLRNARRKKNDSSRGSQENVCSKFRCVPRNAFSRTGDSNSSPQEERPCTHDKWGVPRTSL